MTYNNWKLITERVHAHTRGVMIECADSGHGCDHGRALRSAMRLLKLIEGVVEEEREGAIKACQERLSKEVYQ